MKKQRFYEALSLLIDGQIEPELFRELEDHLLESEEARRAYREFIHLQSLTQLELNLPQSANVVPMDRVIARQRHRAIKIAAFSAAAIFIIGLVLLQLISISNSQSSVTFKTSPQTEFRLVHEPSEEFNDQSALTVGSRLIVEQGVVELEFGSGVRSIVMAPADLTLHDDDTLLFDKGTAWFNVPKGAKGFTVRTKDLDIVDLGTEFGVLAKADDPDEVHVLKGKVEVTANRLDKESATLSAGEARRIDLIGRLITIQSKESAFLTSRPKTLPYLHWAFDEDDHFQVTGNHPLVDSIKTTAGPTLVPVPSKQGAALSLNGKGQFLSTDWDGFSENRPRTVSFWLKIPLDGNYQRNPGIVGWGDRTQKNGKWKITLDNKGANTPARIRLSWGNCWITSRAILPADTWQHVVITSNGKLTDKGLPQAEIYLNGNLMSIIHGAQGPREITPPKTTTITSQSVPLMIGCDLYPNQGDRNFFTGEIDELKIFDGYMTTEDVQELISQ